MDNRSIAAALVLILLSPLAGSIAAPSVNSSHNPLDSTGFQLIEKGQTTEIPIQGPIWWNPNLNWWEYTSLDLDKNGIHDSLQTAIGPVNVGLSYSRDVTNLDKDRLESLGFEIHIELPIVDALLLGDVDATQVWQLAALDGVVMVERYGSLVFFGDVQTPAVKAMNSSEYPIGAWDFGVTGKGINIAMVDTGVDNEHPGLNTKFVAGYDAVCFVHSDPQCILAGGREDDGSFDPDDGNQ
ncbi:MAG: hypothetical protein ACPHKZ_04760, partial [Candidatus Thalassarchaeaceae archaeon]